MLRRFLTIAFVLSAVLLVLPLGRVTLANNDTVVTSTAKLPFAGSLFDSVTGESVHISGDLHVVTEIIFSSSATTLDLHGVLPADVDATGVTTGCTYIALGAFSSLLTSPPLPSTAFRSKQSEAKANLKAAYTAEKAFITPTTSPQPFSPSPVCQSISHLPDSLFLQLNLLFAADGTLLVGGEGGSTVLVCGDQIGSCQVIP
jgi:hypothetical protein